MSVISSRAKKLARTLLRENRRGRSYRAIAREDYKSKVNQATLSRIAREKGEWIPKDEQILILLGLKAPCKPKVKRELLPGEKETKKRIALMAKNLRNSFKEFTNA